MKISHTLSFWLSNMSSRALRKLHGNAGIVIPGLGTDQDSHGDDVDSNDGEEGVSGADINDQPALRKRSNRKKKRDNYSNPFDLLCEDEDLDATAEAADSEHEDTPADGATRGDCPQETPSSRSKKKKKKKKKHKNDQTKDESNQQNGTMDGFDASIQEVNDLFGYSLGNQNSSSAFDPRDAMTLDMKALLTVEHRNLNPDNEMRRIFGSRVVQSDQSRRGRNRVYRKSSWLTRPKDNWPKFGKTGLSMNVVESPSTSGKCFVLEHSKQYQKVQFLFLDAVESMDPQTIMDLTSVHPYHVDSLLQLSEICKMSEDLQMAAELIERALYVFECGFHPLFSLTLGNCRLDYRQAENRAFFLALFRHLVFVGERGCYRTSLEFCKLILSLDPDEDPLCVLLMIDFYALRSEQYTFLVRMFNEWEAHRNLSQLPNFAFSVPLAMFHQATADGKDLGQADAMLQNSLMMFPSMVTQLMDKCGVVIDPQVATHAFFGAQAELCQTEALRHLVALYVGRTHASWKEPEVLTWLERNVKEVLRRVDDMDPLPNEYAERRKNRYKGTPRNIYRHIIIAEIKEAKATLPPELSSSPVLSYDPLPPLDSIAAYERPERRRRVQEAGPLSMFFRSLLPNFNIQELAADEPVGGAAGGARANLQEGIGAVMDAMRDLLQNIRPVAPPVEGGVQQDEGDEVDDDRREEWD